MWATVYGAGAYCLGEQVRNVLGPLGIALLAVTAVLVIAGFFIFRRQERRLEEEAERAFPGPLTP